MKELFGQIGSYISRYGYKLLLCACIAIVGICITWLICFALKKILFKTRIDGAIVSFISSIVRIISLVILVLACAGILELSTSGLIASLSTLVLAVGLALKDSFANIANGILIITNKPFRRGDHVSINGVEGKVHSIKLFTVELITFGNVKIVMPNSTVLNGNIVNYTALAIRRCDMKFSVAYGSDMDKVERVLTEVATNHPQVLKSMKFSVFMESHDASAITYSLRVWCNNSDYYNVLFSMPRIVYDAFEREHIQIPFNQLDVHVCKDE